MVTDVSSTTAASASQEPSTEATSFTSCNHLLGGYLRLPCLVPSINSSLPRSPPPSLLSLLRPASFLSSLHPLEFILLKSFVKLVSVLPQELPSYTEGVSGVFMKSGLSGSLFMCNLPRLLYCSLLSDGREKAEHFTDCYEVSKHHPPGHSRKHLDCGVDKMEFRQVKKEKS